MTLGTVKPIKVLIVGASSGMGFALAKRCLDSDATVIIAGRSGDRLQRARDLLGRSPKLDTATVDITREDEVAALFEQTGPLDHIVNTAADISGAYTLISTLDMDAARHVVDCKLHGALLLAKYGACRLSPSGSITFTSGIAAYRPMARGSVVAAVNAALEGLVRALAVELAPIRINAVSPGWVDTPIWTTLAGEKKQDTLDAMSKRLPVGRVGQPEDIAEAIGFLMKSSFTTGTTLHVEGGHRLI